MNKTQSMRQINLQRVVAVILILFAPIPLDYGSAVAQIHQISINIWEVKALDKFDDLTRGDIYARVTTAGQAITTPVMKQTTSLGAAIKTNWVITRDVPAGTHPVKLELIDKDIRDDDLIDINRLNSRRILEFTVDTRRCKIEGFATGYRCNSQIIRAGRERKSAEIAFAVEAKK